MPNQDATRETCPNNPEPTLGSTLASQPVADCRVSGASLPLQTGELVAAGPGSAAELVEVDMAPVPGMEFVFAIGLIRGWSWRNLRSNGGGLLIHSCTRRCSFAE